MSIEFKLVSQTVRKQYDTVLPLDNWLSLLLGEHGDIVSMHGDFDNRETSSY